MAGDLTDGVASTAKLPSAGVGIVSGEGDDQAVPGGSGSGEKVLAVGSPLHEGHRMQMKMISMQRKMAEEQMSWSSSSLPFIGNLLPRGEALPHLLKGPGDDLVDFQPGMGEVQMVDQDLSQPGIFRAEEGDVIFYLLD